MWLTELLFVLLINIIFVIDAAKYAKSDIKKWDNYRRKYSIFSFKKENVEAFIDNLNFIEAFNKNSTFQLGLNEHAHLTDHEYDNLMNKKLRILNFNDNKIKHIRKTKPIPDFVDWREKGIINKPRNQLTCGSCYTFSTTAAIEAHLKLYKNETVTLSPQQIVDCSNNYGNDGCNGGMEVFVYEYAMNNELYPDKFYPYKYMKNDCKEIKNKTGYKIKDYLRVGGQTDEALTMAIAFQGPVTTGFNSRSREFKFYHSGIFESSDCSRWILDHSVLVVGYSLNSSTPYYIVKNSYGNHWGENGFFRVKYHKNHCGLATDASLPIV